MLIFFGNRRGFRGHKLQQQLQTMKIVEDFACEDKKNFEIFGDFVFFHFSSCFFIFSIFCSFFEIFQFSSLFSFSPFFTFIFFIATFLGRKINFTNSETLVCRCRDRPQRALHWTCPIFKNLVKKNQKLKNKKKRKIFFEKKKTKTNKT